MLPQDDPIAPGRAFTTARRALFTLPGRPGSLILIQSRDGLERYGAVNRFETMPSKPSKNDPAGSGATVFAPGERNASARRRVQALHRHEEVSF